MYRSARHTPGQKTKEQWITAENSQGPVENEHIFHDSPRYYTHKILTIQRNIGHK